MTDSVKIIGVRFNSDLILMLYAKVLFGVKSKSCFYHIWSFSLCLLLDIGLNIFTSHVTDRIRGYFTVNALYKLLTYLLA